MMAMESACIRTCVFVLPRHRSYFDTTPSRLLGLSPNQYKRTKKEFLDRIHPEDRGEVVKVLSAFVKKKTDIETDFRVLWINGTVRFLIMKAKVVVDDRGLPIRLIGLLLDNTDQRLLQLKLRENIRKTDSIFNNFNGAVFRCKFDEEMTMEYISVGVKELTGFPFSDFLMNRVRSFSSLIYIDDIERVMKSIRDALTETNSFTVEYRIVSAQNEIKWIWGRGKGVYENDKILALEGFFSDITDRKNIEEELKSSNEQLHQVAQHIEEVREKERLAISRELHDDLGQALTAVKIDLATIKQNVTDMATVLKINRASALVSDTIKTVQKITSQLRPQIIDDLGLGTAIEWYTREYEHRNRIKIILDLDSYTKIPPDDSLILFRIMQEALTNIARYADATTVKIILERSGVNIHLLISDNGIGLNEDKINSKTSFGILGMKERAASLGGTLEIFRKDNCFTIVDLIFPLKKK